MYTQYLITGVSGFLGNTIAWNLHEKGIRCKGLVRKGDPYISKLPPDVELCYGDVLDLDSLEHFFEGYSEETCLVHCAGIISVASRPSPLLYKVNVEGTRNILQLSARNNIGRIIYISSIDALPEQPVGEMIQDPNSFDENLVKSHYGKSKAMASNLVLQAAQNGLNASVVLPAAIFGPGDWKHGQITGAIISYCKGKLPIGVSGGNNFVDVRDVADGILGCAEYGSKGECYFLSGYTLSMKEILERVRNQIDGKKLVYLPLPVVKAIAPVYEGVSNLRKNPSFLTPYSAHVLGINTDYSYDKAEKTFGFIPRSPEESIDDTVQWLRSTNQIC